MLDFLVGNDALSAIVAFALVLIPAVFIHELGHFLAAKAVGITILEFGIGFPPRMVKLFTRGETEYTLNWLPIGGFVRPLGEDFVRPVSKEVMEKDKQDLYDRIGESLADESDPDANFSEREVLRARGVHKMMSVNEASPLARIFFMTAGAIANLLTGFVLFMIIGLSGLPTIVGASVGIGYVEPNSAPAEAGLQTGDVILKINGNYFDGIDQFFAQALLPVGVPVTLTARRGDQVMDVSYTPATLLDATLDSYVFVSGIAANSPAANAGIMPDDFIVAFNGESFSQFEDLPRRTQEGVGQEVTLTLLHDGETRDVTLVPRENPPEGEGAIGISILPAYQNTENGLIFVQGAPQQALVSYSLGESVQYSAERIIFFLDSFVRLPGQLISGALSAEEARFVSPLGISQIGSMFLQQSIEENQPSIILNYIAIISVLLGITQLLPLPMLDGGRIVFVLIEMVRGRPIAPEREGMVHLIGMAFLLSLMVLAFLNDILNPVTNLIR
jgi:regulator of sigma E protease